MTVNKRTVIGLVLLGVFAFVITFGIRSWQLDRYTESMGNAVEDEPEEESFDITAIKVGYNGQTYTLDEFVELEELPVVVDVLIMQEDGTLSSKQAYVSFDDGGVDAIQYIDGVYGRLILPQCYNKE